MLPIKRRWYTAVTACYPFTERDTFDTKSSMVITRFSPTRGASGGIQEYFQNEWQGNLKHKRPSARSKKGESLASVWSSRALRKLQEGPWL
jgi:hypothetical protein